MKKKHYTLTRGEMAVMQVLWDMPTGGTIHEIIERYGSENGGENGGENVTEDSSVDNSEDNRPKRPAYTTVATFLRILTMKGFVSSRRGEQGKARVFSCEVTRAMYSRQMLQEMKHGLFGGSIRRMVNFFVREEDLTTEELRELLDLIEEDFQNDPSSSV